MPELGGIESPNENETKLYDFAEFCKRQENFFTIFLPEIGSRILGEIQAMNPELTRRLTQGIAQAIKKERGKESAFKIAVKLQHEYEMKGLEMTDEELEVEVAKHDVGDTRKSLEPFAEDLYEAYKLLRKKYSNKELKLKFW